MKFSRRLNRYWFSFFWIYFENDVWEGGTVLVAKWGGWEMHEIKQGWLIAYGLSDHDLPSKWFEWGCWGRGKGFRDGSQFPLIGPSSTFSLEGEGFPSLFETVDSATPGMPFVQNDMRLRWEIGRRNYLLLVFIVEESSRQDKSSLLLHVWNNFISVTTT